MLLILFNGKKLFFILSHTGLVPIFCHINLEDGIERDIL